MNDPSQENLLLGITEDQLLRVGQDSRLSRYEFGIALRFAVALQFAVALRNRW
jgi:hypothetical protein